MTNPDRKTILDLAAIAEARGPQPNDFFVCLTKREASAVCYAVAYLLEKEGCDVEECSNCNRYRRLFWDCANALGAPRQGELFSWLIDHDLTIPEGPWEEERQ